LGGKALTLSVVKGELGVRNIMRGKPDEDGSK
jgi:hypothetical protein